MNAPAQLAHNLTRLSKEFKSTDPSQASEIRRAFKSLSFNDCTRTVVYLLEVIGSRDFEFKRVQEANTALQKENSDLRELLALNNITIEKPLEEKTDATPAATSEQSEQTSTPS